MDVFDFINGFLMAVYLQGKENFSIIRFGKEEHIHMIVRRKPGGDFMTFDLFCNEPKMRIVWLEYDKMRNIAKKPEFSNFNFDITCDEFILTNIDEIKKFFIEVEKFV
ncbi:hypothetical protein D3C71_1092220 [compost metagenome]